MWSRDLLRVLQGAGKVAEQLARTQTPEVSTAANRLAKHAVELARVAPHLFGSTSAPAPPTSDAPPAPYEPTAASAAPAPTARDAASAAPVTVAPVAPAVHERKDIAASLPPVEAFAPPPSVKAEAKPVPPVAAVDGHAKAESESAREQQAQTPPPPSAAAAGAAPTSPEEPRTHPAWTEKHVPSSPLSRILGFGGLAAKLAVGTAAEIVRSGGKGGTYSALISDANVDRLAETLCTMRGAALKLGQMLSIQDENLVPSKLAQALERVRQNAHVMPKAQLHEQLAAELGENWREHFAAFDDAPIAAASIGQVHRATLLSGERVAIKIQYPGVAESIESDLLNLKRLVTYTNILPRGLYIDEIIRVGQAELTAECDYVAEAENQERFRALVRDSGMARAYVVPRVHREFSTARVLTTELIAGVAVDQATDLPQRVRDSIGRRILELTIRELFDWRFMQTDPNWSNFLYNAASDTIGLIDFGAARAYDKQFVDQYFNIVWAAANGDEATLRDYSVQLKFLTGDESPAMLRAHVAAGMVVGEPFRDPAPFDFHKSELTKRLGQHTEVFMHGRLTPPPQEAYSLHRKLAGAFLMCIKLRAVVPCRDVLERSARLSPGGGGF
ncbi:hypothetical protein PybrP1_005433 [[Pythium] brassicae (nom. inval.)]|nr:hypothetical protein PybrP1_005433 [[Pythium] brassicae (nom. inval.)]